MSENNNKVRKMFGTDGVRDIAGEGFMTPEAVRTLGAAFVAYQKRQGIEKPKIAIGRDTRISGEMLENALASGITAAGGTCVSLAVIPTPGVSYVVAKNDFDGGAVISASHNPAAYNGVKFLDASGFKLTDADELQIEEFYESLRLDDISERRAELGCGGPYCVQYSDYLKRLIEDVRDRSYPLVIDAAHGAAYEYAVELFQKWNAPVHFYGVDPNGTNINNGVGVTHMGFLTQKTVEHGAKLGIAYDGDTDRVLISDEKGRILDGDIMLWVIARWFAAEKKLGSGLVATIMSNMGLEDLLKQEDISVFRCDVGDRYVLDKMREKDSLLGGEQSGHIIALDYANTGDGLASGILFLKALSALGEDPSTLADRFIRYPQTLRNLRIKDKNAVMNAPEIADIVSAAEEILAGKGRLSLRPSGTEPLIRIFVEAKDEATLKAAADFMEKEIKAIVEDRA
ncbi:phosphoglucosamine mutase [Synergistaceae bacterium OttesenSCG-928-D05]|nr:phosphoglucosamine mutase [Synergistaceae bacterium OttesenSCG-928-D05]